MLPSHQTYWTGNCSVFESLINDILCSVVCFWQDMHFIADRLPGIYSFLFKFGLVSLVHWPITIKRAGGTVASSCCNTTFMSMYYVWYRQQAQKNIQFLSFVWKQSFLQFAIFFLQHTFPERNFFFLNKTYICWEIIDSYFVERVIISTYDKLQLSRFFYYLLWHDIFA